MAKKNKKLKKDKNWPAVWPYDEEALRPVEANPLANAPQLESLNLMGLMNYAIDFRFGRVYARDAYAVLANQFALASDETDAPTD